jgi:hypothetical protein
VVATDYAQQPPVEHHRNLGDILFIHVDRSIAIARRLAARSLIINLTYLGIYVPMYLDSDK